MYLLNAIGRGAIADSAMTELAARSRRWPMTYSARLGRVYFGGRCNRNRPPRGARGQADAFLPRGQKATASPANRDARQDQQKRGLLEPGHCRNGQRRGEAEKADSGRRSAPASTARK